MRKPSGREVKVKVSVECVYCHCGGRCLCEQRQQQILQYEKLVYKIACRLYKHVPLARRAGSVEALVSSGNMALMDIVRLYNPDHPSKAKFITYAYISIRQRMLRDAAHEGVIDLPERLCLSLNRSDEEQRLRPVPFLEVARRAAHARPLPVGFDEAAAREPYRLDDRYEGIEKALDRLDRRDYTLLAERFGLGGQQPMNLRGMAKQRGVTKEAVRQRILTVLGKVKRLAGALL